MVLYCAQLLYGVLVLWPDLILVPLNKAQQALMPDDWHLTLVVGEPDKVVDESVDHPVRQGILLVQQGADEEAGCAWWERERGPWFRGTLGLILLGSIERTAVLHLSQAEQRSGGVEHGDGGAPQNRAEDEGLAQGAGAALAEGQEQALCEERSQPSPPPAAENEPPPAPCRRLRACTPPSSWP